MDTEPLEQRIAAVLADEPVAFAYLFGSVARGGQRPDSDIDVAVHFEPALPAKERFERGLRLGGRLEIELGQQVDLVDLEEAPLRLAGRILQERVVISGGVERPLSGAGQRGRGGR